MSDDFDDFELDGDANLDNAKSSAEPIPGTYLCTIVKMEKKARRDGKGNFINIQFQIDDVMAESHDAYVGRYIWDIFNLGQEALWKIKSLISAVRGEDEAKGTRIPNMTDERVVLDAFEDDYSGTINLRTRKYRNAGKWIGLNLDLTADDEGDEPEGDEPEDDDNERPPEPKKGRTKGRKGDGTKEVEI